MFLIQIAMKTYITILVACLWILSSQYSYAQDKTIKCIYNTVQNVHTGIESIDRDALKAKKRYEVVYNQHAYLSKKIEDNEEWLLTEDHLADYIDLKDSIYTSQIFLNTDIGGPFFKHTCLVTGHLKPYNWQITSETKVINGMPCFKATYTEASFKFYSPQYVAWFTMDVPISVGPMMQTNLPGMVVQLISPSLIYNLDSFSYSTDADLVKPTKGQPVTEEEHNNYMKAYDAKLESIARKK